MLYITLALAGLLPAAWIIYRRHDGTLLATYFVAAAFVHTADWLASGVLGLYKYHPHLFSDLMLDDATGVILAELIFVASLAVLLVALVDSWWSPVIGSVVVTVLEIYFRKVGALEYKGWHLWYSSIGFAIYFSLIRYGWLRARRAGRWPTWMRRLALAIAFNGLFEILLWAVNAATWSIALLPSQEENQALMRFLWHAGVYVPLLYWTIAARHPGRALRIPAAIVFSITANTLISLAGWRVLHPPWNPVVLGLLRGIFFAVACLTDDWIEAWTAKSILG